MPHQKEMGSAGKYFSAKAKLMQFLVIPEVKSQRWSNCSVKNDFVLSVGLSLSVAHIQSDRYVGVYLSTVCLRVLRLVFPICYEAGGCR